MLTYHVPRVLYGIVCFFCLVQTVASVDLGLECTVFDVGQGSGAVIRDKQRGVSFIIDAGNSGSKEETSPLLRRFNNAIFGKAGSRQRVAGILLSHSDGDHVQLLTRVLNTNSRVLKDQNTHPDQTITAYLGSPFTGYLVGSGKPCLDALVAVNARIRSLSHVMTSEEVYKVQRGEVAMTMVPRSFFMNTLIPEFSDPTRELTMIIMAANALHEGASKFLGTEDVPGSLDDATPEADTVFGEGTNNNGAIVKLTYRGKRIIFPGDVDGDHGTDKLLAQVPAIVPPLFLKADILLSAHHGADRGRTNNIAWLLMSDPHYIIVSAGERGGDFIHPRFSVLYTMAGVLRLNVHRVLPHIIQCGDPTGSLIRGSLKVRDHFCLEAGSLVEAKESHGIEWMIMSTHLPLYTTRTSGDIQIFLSAMGDLTIGET